MQRQKRIPGRRSGTERNAPLKSEVSKSRAPSHTGAERNENQRRGAIQGDSKASQTTEARIEEHDISIDWVRHEWHDQNDADQEG